MYVDDHNEMCGGKIDALTIRLSPEEVDELKKGHILTGENKGRGISIAIMTEEHPHPTSAS